MLKDFTPRPIAAILESQALWILVRLLISFMFWWEGLQFLLNFGAVAGGINVLGLQPVWLGPAITVFIMIVGAILIILDRWIWLGVGMLCVFTAMTIPTVHPFWTMEGAERMANWQKFEEHVATIGGLISLAIISQMRKSARGAL
jgi:transmembrane protein